MRAHTKPNNPESRVPPAASNPERACPLCGGAVVDVRSGCRCARCAFTLCEGCEGGPADPQIPED